MNERFFFRYAKEIKDIFEKYGVRYCKIRRTGSCAVLFMDFNSDTDDFSGKLIDLENDILRLSNSRHEVVNINFFSYDLAGDIKIFDTPIAYDLFLTEGLIQMARKGAVQEIEGLVSAGVNVNYQDPEKKNTPLHAALSELTRILCYFHNDVVLHKVVLENIIKLRDVVSTLISCSNINLSIVNAENITPLQAAINNLPENNSNRLIGENEEAAHKIIENVFMLLQNKGLKIHVAEILKKGYPIIAEALNKSEQVVYEKPALTVSTTKAIAQHGLYATASTTTSGGSDEADTQLSSDICENIVVELERIISQIKKVRFDTAAPEFKDQVIKTINQLSMLFPDKGLDRRNTPA